MANMINFNDIQNATSPGQDKAFCTLARRICKMINKNLALRQFDKFLPEDQLAFPMSHRLLSKDRSLLVEVSFSAITRQFIFTFQDSEYTQIPQSNVVLDKICSDLTKYYSIHDERLLKRGKFTRFEYAKAKNGIIF